MDVVDMSTQILMLLTAVASTPAGPSSGQLVVGSIAVAFITGATALGVAIVNNSRERTGSAESSLVMTLRERITLKDELLTEADGDIEKLEKKIARKDELIAELRARNQELESASESDHGGA